MPCTAQTATHRRELHWRYCQAWRRRRLPEVDDVGTAIAKRRANRLHRESDRDHALLLQPGIILLAAFRYRQNVMRLVDALRNLRVNFRMQIGMTLFKQRLPRSLDHF